MLTTHPFPTGETGEDCCQIGRLLNITGAANILTNTGAFNNQGRLIATNGAFVQSGVASGPGAYAADSAGTLTFGAGGSISALFNTNGTVVVQSALTNALAGAFQNVGALIITNGQFVSAAFSSIIAGPGANTTGSVTVLNLGSLYVTNAANSAQLIIGQNGVGFLTNAGPGRCSQWSQSSVCLVLAPP